MNTHDPVDFEPVALAQRRDGWTAERQRGFVRALAETGCVSSACARVGISPRSAYRLRNRDDAAGFAAAWDAALQMASHFLLTHAFERAVHGTPRRIIRDGVVVQEVVAPSDRLLVFLLRYLDPARFGVLSGITKFTIDDPRVAAQGAFARHERALVDNEEPAEPLTEWNADGWAEIDSRPAAASRA